MLSCRPNRLFSISYRSNPPEHSFRKKEHNSSTLEYIIILPSIYNVASYPIWKV